MNNKTEKRLTRSAKKSGTSNSNLRRRMINETDVFDRENIQIEVENHVSRTLFDENVDVSGKNIYKQEEGFKRGKMIDKAKSCVTEKIKIPIVYVEKINTSKANTSRKNDIDIEHFIKELLSDTEDIEESVSEDSEYELDDSDDTEEYESDDDVEEEEDDDENQGKRINNKKSYSNGDNNDDNDKTVEMDQDESENEAVGGAPIKQKIKKLPVSSSSKKISANKNDYKEMHYNTEEYFESQSEKILTSNHTLGRLKTAKLDKETIDKLLEKNLHISDYHSEGIARLHERNITMFSFWHFMLKEGFSILLHGLGSKRSLIHEFQQQRIKGCPALIINGFFPSLTLKEILDGIIKDLMDLEVPSNVNDCMELIEATLKKHPNDRIYLLIHNIDGPALRLKKIQDKLSYLASFPNLHLVASVDHIHASLLWDNAKRARYNFYWCNATTFMPYKDETSYENSLMIRQSGALALSSLHNVFLSLPDKSRSVYIILVNYQIENAHAHYQGMAFKDLYQKAREGFFVTNEITLRTQLTEFLDHKLIKEKRGVDGIQYLTIPLDKALLQQFLEQQEDDK
ncbi:origin recognition complex subunit 2 [Leptopilina boulardi]|uniref:origin recognition complex subunit 2 n=1 Tax=Leptopilina boulardi TaxID=63433 RepID=UPI0021F545EA|nr:origin recognition complex subunit 2 [Leptopilina boulardi]